MLRKMAFSELASVSERQQTAKLPRRKESLFLGKRLWKPHDTGFFHVKEDNHKHVTRDI